MFTKSVQTKIGNTLTLVNETYRYILCSRIVLETENSKRAYSNENNTPKSERSPKYLTS